MPVSQAMCLGLALRIAYLLLGVWLDSDALGLGLRYTDVDYSVYTDAAKFVYQGRLCRVCLSLTLFV